MARRKVVIMGAAGRDFHNFNVYFRDNENYEVVAFTASEQIPDITDKRYPPELSGDLYPEGIPILAESQLEMLIKEKGVEEAVLAYSDLPYEYVMHISAKVNAYGADFTLMGPNSTMLKSSKPVVSVCAIRTGCGKSQTSREVFRILKNKGRKVVSIRHPMPYDDDLVMQKCQRFATYEDLKENRCTIEEMEEYEPYIEMGGVVYAGIDYGAILAEAEKEADVIIWDGGNNDFPFYKADLEMVVVDPHRPGHERLYYPGEVNFLRAGVVVINKMATASQEGIDTVKENIRAFNPEAVVIEADSPVTSENPEAIKGKRVLVVEDGPTTTHGGMAYGAGFVAAKQGGVAEIIDPRPYAVDSIQATFKKYPHLENILPAMGYGDEQVEDLRATMDAADCDVVLSGTPISLKRLLDSKGLSINKPIVRVKYELKVREGSPQLAEVLKDF